jgi:hypothetical protein
MNRNRVLSAIRGLVAASVVAVASSVVTASPAPVSGATAERHHYTMNARVRPLLVFWISKSNIGDAMTLRRQDGVEREYSLLIGSDPERAPRKINRWGYIDEETRGPNATVTGLMTQSDEDSIEQAEANIAKREGERIFKVIHGSIVADQAQSVVTSVPAPSNYSFHRVDTLLDLARRDPRDGRTRSVKLMPDTRPGFLFALADLIREHVKEWKSTQRVGAGAPVAYVYHGKIYQLRATRVQMHSAVKTGSAVYPHAIASQFEIKNTVTGEITRFSMTYGTEGSVAEVPLTASFQPKWWLEVEIALDDSTPGPTLATEDRR